MDSHSGRGYSLAELTIVTALVATMAAFATPRMLAAADEFSALGAARYVAALLQQTRMAAITRRADMAVRFTSVGAVYGYAQYVDGNNNGIRSRDIASGIDREVRGVEHLGDQFPGVEFGTLPNLPAVDSSTVAPGSDPIRLGSGNMASFGASGTGSSGSLYLRSRRGSQYVIRIFGETGRTRILKFDPGTRQWRPL